MPGWTIREADARDDAGAEAFLLSIPEFRDTLRGGETRLMWRWLYARSGVPVGNVLVAEDPQGRMIAHYGLSPLPYVLAGEHVNAGMACLLAIAEAYRKTPVFLDVTSRLLKRFRTGDWTFLTGLANRGGLLEFHKAFGFSDVGEVPIFAKPVRPKAVVSAMLPKAVSVALAPFLALGQWLWLIFLRGGSKRASRDIRLERIGDFDDATAATSAELSKYHRWFADRSTRSILNERFFGLPSRTYTVFKVVRRDVAIGYVALRVMDMKGFLAVGIVDLCFDFSQADAAHAIFHAIDCFAIEQRADLISILTNSGPLIAQLRRHWYLRAPESFRLVIFEPSKRFGLAASRIDDWFITWFEHDYV